MNTTVVAKICNEKNNSLMTCNQYINRITSSEIHHISKDQTINFQKGIKRIYIMKGTGYVRKKEKI